MRRFGQAVGLVIVAAMGVGVLALVGALTLYAWRLALGAGC